MRVILCQCAGLLAMMVIALPFIWFAWFEPNIERAVVFICVSSVLVTSGIWGYAEYQVRARRWGDSALYSVLYTLLYPPCALYWYAKWAVNSKR